MDNYYLMFSNFDMTTTQFSTIMNWNKIEKCDSRSLQLIGVILRPDEHPRKASEDPHELDLRNGLSDEVRPPTSKGPSLDVVKRRRNVIPLVLRQGDFDRRVLSSQIPDSSKSDCHSGSFENDVRSFRVGAGGVTSSGVPRNTDLHVLGTIQ